MPSATVNQVEETDLAQVLTCVKKRTVAQTSTTNTAQLFTKKKVKGVGQPSTTNTAQTLTRNRRRGIALVADFELAQALGAGTLGKVLETDQALPITSTTSGNNNFFATRTVLASDDIDLIDAFPLEMYTTQSGEYLGSPALSATAWFEWVAPLIDTPEQMTWAFSFWGEGVTGGATIRVYEDSFVIPPNAGDEVIFSTVTGDYGTVTTTLLAPTPGTTYFIQIGFIEADGEMTSDFTSSFVPEIELTADEIDGDLVENDVWVDVEDESDVPSDVPALEGDVSDIGVLRRVSETYGTPTITNGRPDGWLPSSTTDVLWGRVGIAIDGVSVTKVRGVKSELNSLMLQEPFGEGPAQITIRGATDWDIGQVGFEWLAIEKNVDISHYDSAGTYVKTLWTGIVSSMTYSSDGWSLDCDGTFAGIAGMLPLRPKLTEKERDWGVAMTYAIRRAGRGASRRKTITEVTFGIPTRDRGARSETLLEYVTRGLGMSQTDAGGQWTLGRVVGNVRKYEWRLKDTTTIQVTVHSRTRGITHDLRQDLNAVNRLIMAEGVNIRGGRWRNAKLPNVGKETVPAWPGFSFGLGDTGEYVTIWKLEALSDGHRTGDLDALTGETFTDEDEEACKEIQKAAGLAITGIVNHATWDATWSNGDVDLNLGGARFDPLAADDRVIPFLYSSNGSATAYNPDWDRTLLPLGRFISYGSDISKKRAKKSAEHMIDQETAAGWHGSITIDNVDPVEMSRLDIREGYNIRLKWFGGVSTGIVLHIAGVNWRKSGPSWAVTLDVDQKARDLLTLAELWRRDREAKQDPVRQAISQLRRGAQVRDTPAVWDSEGGFGVLPERDAEPGWNIYKVAAGQYGSLSRIKIRTSPKSTFTVALFGAKVTKKFLKALVPDPTAGVNDNNYLPWDKPSIQQDLRDVLFIEAFGGFNQRGGYSPGYETHPTSGTATGHPITGKLDMESGTNYALDAEPKMWVAFYNDTEVTVKVKGHIFLLPNE